MNLKAVISIVVLLVLVVAAWYFVGKPSSSGPVDVSQQNESGMPILPTGVLPEVSNTGTSDASLDADLEAVDAQVDVAASASADASSFTDTPVEQTE